MADDRPVIWRPHPGPQTEFFRCYAFELCYGGAAGGGKSDGLLAGPLRWINEPGFRAVLHRRTRVNLTEPHGLWERSHELYLPLGARPNASTLSWRWPSGAVITLAGLEHLDDAFRVRGELQYLGFDELTTFLEQQYRYRLTRLRSAEGIPVRVRSSTNPEPGWVKDRFAPWVDRSPEYLDKVAAGLAVTAESGEILWYVSDQSGNERYVPRGTQGALSRCFIKAKLTDNPTLLEKDPGYIDRLQAQDYVTRERLLGGNWEAKPAKGLYFKRAWCMQVDISDVPHDARLIRFWDRASTDVDESGGDPDWTSGTLLANKGPIYWIVDRVHKRTTPGGVDDFIAETARLDQQNFGERVEIGMWQDPGQAGKDQKVRFVQRFAGMRMHTFTTQGDRRTNSPAKVQNFGPFSAMAEHHHVRLVRGSWNDSYCGELESFPEGNHDDDADSTSGGFRVLTRTRASNVGCSSAARAGHGRGGARAA